MEYAIDNHKNTPKSNFGGSWATFGEGLGRSEASLGDSWMSFGRFFLAPESICFSARVPNGPQERSQSPSGLIWGQFWSNFE